MKQTRLKLWAKLNGRDARRGAWFPGSQDRVFFALALPEAPHAGEVPRVVGKNGTGSEAET